MQQPPHDQGYGYGHQPAQPGFGPPPPQYAYPPQPPQPPPSVPSGPEFLAVDRHNSIVVDSTGVTFEDHDLTVDFPWPEIRSVHYKASPNGKVLMVAVVHLDGRMYECAVDAKPRDRLLQWFAQLAQVLGYYRPMG